MIPRLDLLQERERRYQGPVSRRFLVNALVALVCGVALAFVGTGMFRALRVRTDVANARAAIAALAPFHQRMLDVQSILTGANRYREELAGWSRARHDWHVTLFHLQREIPANIQLVRLDMTDDLRAPAPAPGTTAPAPGAARRFVVRFSGRAHGALAEDEVRRFIEALRPATGDSPFRAVTLLSMQQEGGTRSLRSSFEIEAQGAERPLR